ncbi:MAG: hypothetical protein NXH95_02570 [Pseudomonadaceae bacterium]|nr:hypothetical protein [Pseudomonadaceae bacterium]
MSSETRGHIEWNEPQARALTFEERDETGLGTGLFSGGGRRGGKTKVSAGITGHHIADYGPDSHVLIYRRHWSEIATLQEECFDTWRTMLGPDAFTHNKQERRTRFKNGAVVRWEQFETADTWTKVQGAGFTLIWCEEIQQWPNLTLFDRIATSLSGPAHVPLRLIVTANPGGIGHSAVRSRFVKEFPNLPPVKYRDPDTKRLWLFNPSTPKDNPIIYDQYRASLAQIRKDDPELADAFEFGAWDIRVGAFFGSSFEEDRCVLKPWSKLPNNVKIEIGADWGSASPAAFSLVATFTRPTMHEDQFFKENDSVVFDEFHTAVPEDLDKGSQMPAAKVAEHVTSMWRHWGLPGQPHGVLDSAAFADLGVDSPGAILRANGVSLRKSQKQDRAHGWAMMRQRFANCNNPEATGAALYYTANCDYARDTTLTVEHHKTRREDLVGPDHSIDGIRYLVNFKPVKRRSREFAL